VTSDRQRPTAGIPTGIPTTPPPHARTVQDVLAQHGVEPARGLSDAAARERLARDGPNELIVNPPPTLLALFARQFKSAIVLLLIAATVISYLAGDAKDAVVILAILIVNALVGTYQEARAESALTALREMTPAGARCRRDGVEHNLLARDVVVGDIVLLRAGDMVPADGRLLETVSLAVDESALTGESVPVEKRAAADCDADAVPGDRFNMAFQGTAVTAGHAEIVVTGTGMQTEMGLIAASLARATSPQTPLERQVAWLTRFLSLLAIGAAVAVFALGQLRGEPLHQMFLVALSLAVAAVPEGLPAVVTIVLALGVQRMARRHAIVRRLAAVEALGSVTVICTDKTGTLTRGEMRVVRALVGDRELQISDDGLREGDRRVRRQDVAGLHDLLTAAVLCNNAQLGTAAAGDPTERALLHMADDLNFDAAPLVEQRQRAHEIPFDSIRKRMATVYDSPDGDGLTAYVKGAPDMVLHRCSHRLAADGLRSMDDADRQHVLAQVDRLASQGLRTLALTHRTNLDGEARAVLDGNGAGSGDNGVSSNRNGDVQATPSAPVVDAIEDNLTLLGIVGLMDPPRPEVPAALAAAHTAGVRTVMVTGDHPITARAIGASLGLGDGRILTGAELQQLDDEALATAVKDLSICARVAPEQKVDIVRAFQAGGEIVGMTGDGSNDAPALRSADIGVAMGIRGTAVAKEAAAIVLADDNFASIVAAIEEGRTIYANLRKTILFLVAGNIGEVLAILLAMVAGLPLPLQAIQILWINLVTDSLPAIGLAMEPAEPGVMGRRPRPRGESFLPWWLMPMIGVPGILLAAVSVFAFVVMLDRYPGDLATAQTTAFTTLILAQLGISWSQRGTLTSSLRLSPRTNPLLTASILLGVGSLLPLLYTEVGRTFFHTVALGLDGWLLAILLSPVPLIGAEAVKIWIRPGQSTAPTTPSAGAA